MEYRKSYIYEIYNYILNFLFDNQIEILSLFDNWLTKLSIIFFIGFIFVTIYTALTEEKKV